MSSECPERRRSAKGIWLLALVVVACALPEDATAQPVCYTHTDQLSYYDTDRAEIHISYLAQQFQPEIQVPVRTSSNPAGTTVRAVNDGDAFIWFTGHLQFRPGSTPASAIGQDELAVQANEVVTIGFPGCEIQVGIGDVLRDTVEFNITGHPNFNDKLDIAVSQSRRRYIVDAPTTYTVTVHNQSPPNNVVVMLRMFLDLDTSTVDRIQGSVGCPFAMANEHRCNLGVMQPNQSTTFTVDLIPSIETKVLQSSRFRGPIAFFSAHKPCITPSYCV